MQRFIHYILVIGFVLGINMTHISCIKQSSEECPPVYRGMVTVKDKNYANAASIPSFLVKNEQAPLNEFIHQISYHMIQEDTGNLTDSLSDFTIPDGEQTHVISFPNLVPGPYIVHMQGNVSHPAMINNDIPLYALHPSGQEGDDVYLFEDTVLFSPESPEAGFPLHRTKGALFIQIENLPDTVYKIQETVEYVYAYVDENNIYSDQTTVKKTFTTDLHPLPSLFTLLAPTVASRQSVLHLALYGPGSDTPYMFIPEIPFIIRRNEVTAFKFNFIPGGGIEVWVISNGEWSKSHDLDVTL